MSLVVTRTNIKLLRAQSNIQSMHPRLNVFGGDLYKSNRGKLIYLHIDKRNIVNGGKALDCLESSSLDVQDDITDLCACVKTA